MNAAELERLMNDVLDGVATPVEEALLRRHLASRSKRPTRPKKPKITPLWKSRSKRLTPPPKRAFASFRCGRFAPRRGTAACIRI